MNHRIEKKLSKRIAQILPNEFKDAWVCDETGCLHVGGGLDYWGEGQDAHSVLASFASLCGGGYEWYGIFGFYPEGHAFEHYPYPDQKRKTGKRIIEVAQLIASSELSKATN